MPTDPAIPPGVPSGEDDFDLQVTGIAALAEPIRRALYRFVVAQPHPVSRDQAAQGAVVARHVAKFHLDKLVADGLLDVEYARPPGRSGPGAGRPTKFYRRSSRQLMVSVPERHYELAGRLFAAAVTNAQDDGGSVSDALSETARQTGRSLGHQARARVGSRPSRAALLDATTDVLRRCGYEPRVGPDGVALVNCPFHSLAQEYTDLVCGMNLDLIVGLVDGLESTDLEPRLAPADGRCCVRLDPATSEDHPSS